MKICFVIQNLGYGGAERVAINLVDSWIKLNHEVFFIFTSTKPNNTYPNDFKHYYLSKDKKINPLLKIRKTIKILKMEKPDIVVSFLSMPSFIAAVSASYLKIPVICSERNDPATCPSNKVIRFLRYLAFKKANVIVFQTQLAMNFFNDNIKKKGLIIVNPLSKNFEPSKNLGKSDQKKFVSVGRLAKQKNYKMMINSFELIALKHKDAVLHIYGEGPEKDKIMEYIHQKQISGNIILEGIKDISEIYENAYAFLMSSDFEGYPNALLEALCVGIPCICTNCPCGGPKDLQNDNQSLLLSNVNDVQSFSNNIEYLILNYEKLFSNAQQKKDDYMLKHNIESVSKQWIDIMLDTLNKINESK